MLYCARWNNKLKYEFEFDELIIKFKPKAELLIKFLKDHKDQTIILDAAADDDLSILVGFRENPTKYPQNFKVRFTEIPAKTTIEKLKGAAVPYFYAGAVETWDAFHGLLCEKVSDIYITNDLCFELDKVRAAAPGITLRAIPNLKQAGWHEMEASRSFWIRPEDVSYYDSYIDVLEFYQEPNSSRTNPDTLYEIYAKVQKWSGDLKELIIDFNESINGKYLLTDFAVRRMKCGKHCLKGRPCNLCFWFVSLSKTLEEKGLLPNSSPPI